MNTTLIEFCFSNYGSIKNAIEEKRLDPGGATITGGNGTGHSRISDPTAIKALRNVSELSCVTVFYGASIQGERDFIRIRRPETWLKVIDDTKKAFLGKPQLGIALRKYEQHEDWQQTCKELRISRGKYYAMLNDVLHQAELFAVAYGVQAPYCWAHKGDKDG